MNYNLFLQDIRDALDELGERTGRFYGLTAALPCVSIYVYMERFALCVGSYSLLIHIMYNKKTYTSLLLPYQGPDLISNIQIDVVSGILTELNLMTYDFHG